MGAAHQQLQVRLWTNYNKTALYADLSGRWMQLSFSTALHGGFKDCRVDIPLRWEEAALYLQRENSPGVHFMHLEIGEEQRIIWEGRIMSVEIAQEESFQGIRLQAFGYWSSARDRLVSYGAIGAGTAVSTVIKNLITTSMPDINGTVDIDANSQDVGATDLGSNVYPQDIIIEKLAPLNPDANETVYYFSVWDNRKPSWKPRSASAVDWFVWRRDLANLRVRQDATTMRNSILPVAGTAAGTSTIDVESTGRFGVRREVILQLPVSTPNGVMNEARDMMLADRKKPHPDAGFSIKGTVYTTRATHIGTAAPGAMIEVPKWRVRAGQVLRIQDLLPASQAVPAFDDLRTFYLLETIYDAQQDLLTVQPDRPASGLGALLARLGQLELKR